MTMRNVGWWFLRIACPCMVVFFGVPAIYRMSQGDWGYNTFAIMAYAVGLVYLTVMAWKR